MKDWGSENEVDYIGLILGCFFVVVALMLISAALQGCAPTWPDIGGGVKVQEIRIMKCSDRPDDCNRRV